MQILSQRDSNWGNIKLGTSNTYIKDYGCTITCLAMLIGTTPNVINDRLNAVQGFANGNLVIWAKIEEAFPGIKIRRVWSYDNNDVKANVPNIMVEVPAKPIGGTGSHWVVYLGNQRLNDPWTGKERPTSDFPNPTGYCVVTGSWQTPKQETKTVLVDSPTFEQLVGKSSEYDKFVAAGYPHVEDLQKTLAEKESTIQNLTKDLNNSEQQINEYLDQLNKLNDTDKHTSEELLNAQHALQPLKNEILAINKTLGLMDDTDSQTTLKALQLLKESKIKPAPKPTTLLDKILFLLS